MSTPKLQQWLYVKLIMKDRTSGTSSTYYLSNRAIVNDANTARYVPILKEVGDFGCVCGDTLPRINNCTINIDNSPGSYGFERKFSDLFERETPIKQTVELYVAETELDDLNVTADFVLAWTAEVATFQFQGDTLILNITSVGIPVREVVRVVNAVDFPSAPTKSLGQVLPLVFGEDVQIKPVLIDAEGDSSPRFAYATSMSTTYPVGGVSAYFARNSRGEYVEIASASTTTTALYGNAPVAGKSSAAFDIQSITAKAITTTTGGIVTAFSLRVYRSAATAETGNFFYEIREDDNAQASTPTNAPGTTIGKGVFNMSSLSTSTGEYDIGGAFEKPVVLAPGKTYWIVYWLDSSTGDASTSSFYRYYDSAVSESTYSVLNVPNQSRYGFWDDESVGKIPSAKYNKKAYWTLYGVVLTDTKSSAADSNGYGYASFEATQRTDYSGYVFPDLTTIDFIVNVDGLKDSSGGAITGVANTLLEYPVHIIKLLDKEWNGSSWTGGRFDFSKYSDSHDNLDGTNAYVRKIKGRTKGRDLLSSVYEQICRAAAAKITLFNGSTENLALYGWGSNVSSSATITDEDGELIGYSTSGTGTVINKVAIRYNNSLIYQTIDRASNNETLTNYVSFLEYYNGQSAYTTSLLSTSVSLYGTCPLAQIDFDYCKDSTTATSIAEYLVRSFTHPKIIVDIEVPFFKYSTLDLLDVVTIIHPGLPSYLGTSANAALPTYTGLAVDLLQGDYLKRASTYRGQIEGKTIFFDGQSIARMRLSVRLLLNSLDPT